MIPAEFYKYIYLILIAIITLLIVKQRNDLNLCEGMGRSIWLCVFLIFFIGFRPHSPVFGDMANYASWWGFTPWNGWDWNTENKIFDNIYRFIGSISPDATPFFVLIAAIYFIAILIACRKLFPSNTFIVYLVYLAAFSTFSYATNGIKAGAAAALFLVALAYRDKIFISLLFLFLSWGVHHSMVLPVAAYVITIFFKKKEWFFYGWVFCLLMAAGHVSFFQQLFAGLSDKSGAGYLTNNTTAEVLYAKVGFRIDFVIYSIMPVLMGYYVKYKYKLKDEFYDMMLNIYLTTNGIWMLCMYAEFTNRIAYLSWFMYPIVLIYPCYAIKDKLHPLVLNRQKIVLCHLAFTLFMELVYYV